MGSFDWKSLLGKVAPWIATALGGPAAGMATKAIASALGLGEEASEGQIAEAMEKATPEQIAAIKAADADFQLKMKEMDIKSVYDLEKLNADDRANARNREIQVRDKTPMILAFIITVGFFAILTSMMKYDVPEKSRDALNIMLGALAGAWTQGVIGYYFGSSHGSAVKNEILSKGGK